MEMDDSGMKNK